MKKPENMTPPKEQNNFSVMNPKDMELCNLPQKEFKIPVLRMFNKLQRNPQKNNSSKSRKQHMIKMRSLTKRSVPNL